MYYVVKCVIVLNLRDVLLRSENSKYHGSTNNNIHVERKDISHYRSCPKIK